MTMPAQKPGRSRQDFQTPDDFLDAVKHRLGITAFAIDLAADDGNTVADLFYDKDQNALVQSWAVGPGWNWLNPEFGDIGPWVEKAWAECLRQDEIVRTAVLVPAGVGSNWWRDWVHEKAQVLLLNGRLCFIKDWETTIDPASVKRGDDPPRCYTSAPLYPKDCCLLLYEAAEPSTWYAVWDWRREIPR
jgi:phage N-6-adenine-methyltransferase